MRFCNQIWYVNNLLKTSPCVGGSFCCYLKTYPKLDYCPMKEKSKYGYVVLCNLLTKNKLLFFNDLLFPGLTAWDGDLLMRCFGLENWCKGMCMELNFVNK